MSRAFSCAGLSFLLASGSLAACGVSPPGTGAPPAPSSSALAAAPTSQATATASAAASLPPDPPAPPAPPEPARARFLSVGDVIFGRRVQKKIDEKNDLEHPFRPLAPL